VDTPADRVQGLFRAARTAGIQSDNPEVAEMAMNRAVNRRVATGGADLSLASARPKDPLWYWRQGNLPYNIWDDPMGLEMAKVRELCRLLYVTHPLLGSAIDIYTRYPLAGMEIVCPKDPSVADFHSQLFLDELNYEEYLIDLGREFWLVGEGFPLASFNDLTGTFDSDDLMLPEDVNVINTPFSNEPRFEMALPYRIRQILTERYPELEYRQLVEAYPEFLSLNTNNWSTMTDRHRFMIPVSNKLMSHVMRKGDSFHTRGIPLLMRAFRAVAQEEMLNAAQDSISQRLYTPLILARIGASASDLGTSDPWIPQQADLNDFVEDVNAALAADFRLIATHFAVNMQNVFGRESMPRLQQDFEHLEEKMLQAFGLSRTMLTGAGGGQTYAADALNRDLVSQLLQNYQRRMKRFFHDRARVVAEAQGHYDFQRKGGRPVPIMETIMETDDETGEVRFVERPKLLLPDLKIKAMNVKDEDAMNQLLGQLRNEGVPISQRSRLVNVPVDLEEEVEASIEESVVQAVAAQETRKRTYQKLKAQGLPIPQDLIDDFQAKVDDPEAQTEPGSAEEQALMGLAEVEPGTEALLSGVTEEEAEEEDEDPAAKALQPRNRVLSRPPESDEMRATMPKAASFRTAQEIEDDIEFIEVDSLRFATNEAGQPIDDEGNILSMEALGLADDAVLPTTVAEFRDTQAGRLPVIGSYTTRHVGIRDERFFYLNEDAND
jgi:hypothetical protein